MKWITRSRVHVDRVACPWLIARFVDSAGGAIPFDVPGVELGHREGRCSFDAIIEKYGLTDPALLRLARIVRAAETDDPAAEPLAAGLEAIATGYGLRFPDDHENLRRQFEVYDALYAWCRLQVARG
jgi:hypothetical protein